MTVSVVSCLYGHGYEKFIDAWVDSVEALERKPEARLIGAYPTCGSWRQWRYPQAYYLDRIIRQAETDWVWILDIDDTALPDALNGIDDVTEDVWATGYERSDGYIHISPAVTAAEILAAPTSVISGASAVRTEAFRACGGFLDVAFQDWALWRALARNGATFATSGRVNYRYNRHPSTRCATELTADRRAEHLAEMVVAEETSIAVA